MDIEKQVKSLSRDEHEISLADVKNAAERIAGLVHRTPVITSQSVDSLAGARLFFKCEHLQRVGAFKFRGACNAISQLDESSKSRGVVTHSSGNHAQALALAAKLHGVAAHIVMPSSAPKVKRDAVIGYGGNVIDCEPTLAARESTALTVQQRTGAELIHPYNDRRVIEGQGTAALELIDEVPDLDIIIAPVGGGGLISGTCVVACEYFRRVGKKDNQTQRAIEVIAAEPSGADDAFRSKQSGQMVLQTAPDTIADGLLTSLGELTWPYVRDVVTKIVTVDDDRIVETMRFFWQRTKQIVEPSSAVAIAAAIMHGQQQGNQQLNIGVIITGGNVDIDSLPW